ncbi:vacuolar fusion protein CCZ1 homolog [Scaptodrosophila lebanonensis]|uniref:Vacuolar fusion protein CCZ1 homolog n=1 Tax=Drosophila lebanonensis TaxID=7225 RepID=A0A6J2TWZ7_DROLE|nr:vacuolar fusion protein CCZ1 homolog [Scaptodrosophila lebanonensis]
MTKLLQRIEVTLRSFYIFNSSYGQTEGEEYKKILYYHPNDIELNTKIKDVGLSEAIITFTRTFTSDDDCKALHTQKTTQLFYQPEPGFWLVLVLNVPKEIKSKDGIEVAEYRGSEVCDRIYHSVLRQFYYIYRFQYGTLQDNALALNGDAVQLAKKIQEFFDKIIATRQQLAPCDIIDMLHSIQYLPLGKALFLRAHNFSRMLSATFPVLKECIMLHNDLVVCGGKLSSVDLYSLHAYILDNVLESCSAPVLARSSSPSGSSDNYQKGGFVNNVPDEPPLKVQVTLDADLKPHYLLIYRVLNVTLCLFIDAENAPPKHEFYDDVHTYMGSQLISLARDIATEVSKQNLAALAPTSSNSTTDCSPKYLFINEQSLKHHTNVDRHAKGQQSIPRNVMNLIADLANEPTNIDGAAAATEELQVKTTNDFWIVKRRCNWRQYYVILSNSKATLLDVTQEAKRIFEQELTDDVFFDK